MKIKLEAVKLERPILLAGKNFGNTIEVSKVAGLELEYDSDTEKVLVTYNGKTGMVPMGNVDVMMPASAEVDMAKITTEIGEIKPDPTIPETVKLPKKVKAQVSGPTSHVFGGPGAGQTGVATK